MNILYIVPARGGSKGIPKKNIKLLNGKPLIEYSIDVARQLTCDENICVTSDDEEIINLVENSGLNVPFKRPDYLATDKSGTYEVLLHAVEYYESIGKVYDIVVLLQPTSPFRKKQFIEESVLLLTDELDMVVSVKECSSNPYYNCFEEDINGFLKISKGDGLIKCRQDAPKTWEFNGSIYVINVNSLKNNDISLFTKVKSYKMNEIYSLDIDTIFDWIVAETMIKEKIVVL
ncbi:MAG: acylneuraminate cytidylyltransferase family protein [Paludibacter sp.]